MPEGFGPEALDTNPQPLWVYDLSTLRFLAVNDTAVATYGYSREEFLAMTILEIRPVNERVRLLEAVAAVRAGAATPQLWVHQRKDGQTFPVRVTSLRMPLAGHDAQVVLAQDVTQELEAAAHLRASEERFRLVTMATNDAIWDWDVSTDRTWFSVGFEDLFGVSGASGEPTLQSKIARVHPDDRRRITASLSDALRGPGDSWSDEYRFARQDGSYAQVSDRGHIVRDAAGRAIRVVGGMSDVSQRHALEEGRRARSDRLDRMHTAMASLTQRYLALETDVPGALQEVTRIAAAAVRGDRVSVWRFTPDRNAIRCLDLYVAATDRHEAGAELRRAQYSRYFEALDSGDVIAADDARADPRTAQFTASYLEPLGIHSMLDTPLHVGGQLDGVLCIEATGAIRRWAAEERTFAVAIGNLVSLLLARTERRRVERLVAQQAALLDQTQDAILVRGLDHRIQFWNRGAERMYGWSADEAVGRPATELLYGDTSAMLAAMAVVQAEGHWSGELAQVTRTGEQVWAFCRWTLVPGEAGQADTVLCINSDITERRRLEQQFLRAQRLESIGTVAGGIAHDLNNLLAPITMSIGLLREGGRDPDQLEIIRTIETSARRGADMVRQVLAFARGVEGDRVVVQVGDLIRDVARIAEDTFLKTIEIRTQAPASLWPLTGDATQLHQVLLNLCVNARDAMPSGGVLTISATNAAVDEPFSAYPVEGAPGRYVVVTVSDTGSGMPPEVRDRIFEPFYTTKGQVEGTGLGLSTSLAIVQSHGGRITVSSEPGLGSSFRVYLPARAEEPGQPAQQAKPRLRHGRGELVLVVDDEPAIRQITRRALERHGYRVVLAASGSEALTIFEAQGAGICMVLTDLMMPGMDGRTLLRRLREMRPDLRIIRVSGLPHDSAADTRFDRFLRKPFTMEELLATAQEVLGEPDGDPV